MRIIIAGGRTFDNYEYMSECLSPLVEEWGIDTIISCGGYGADSYGESFARVNALDLEKYPANYGKYGSDAGRHRNKKILGLADGLVAFWDGKSKGTEVLIHLAKEQGMSVTIFGYDSKLHDNYINGVPE